VNTGSTLSEGKPHTIPIRGAEGREDEDRKIGEERDSKFGGLCPGQGHRRSWKKYRVKQWIKLASNENLLGPSPKALAAIRKELPGTHFYPEGPCTVLRQALAKKVSLSEKKIVISNGADNIIFMIANAFVDEGDEVVIAEPTFPVYTNSTQIMGEHLSRFRSEISLTICRRC